MDPASRPAGTASAFAGTNVPLLLARFALSYHREGACMAYYICRLGSAETISHSLVFSHSPVHGGLHVSRFYPELYRQPQAKYLSAACFYLMVHHCAAAFSLADGCRLELETVPEVYERFYRRLQDFDFRVARCGLGEVVALAATFRRLAVDTTMIAPHVFAEGEVPFL